MLAAPKDPPRLYNVDEWWIERRLLSRKMIDTGEYRTAYLIARDAAVPARDIYKTEQEFTAGWIALRFLHDPSTAAQHFARIGVGSANPTTLARGGRGPPPGGPHRVCSGRGTFDKLLWPIGARQTGPAADRIEWCARGARARGRTARNCPRGAAIVRTRRARHRHPDFWRNGRKRRSRCAGGAWRTRVAQQRCARHVADGQGCAQSRA